MNCPYCNSQIPNGALKCPVCQMPLQPQTAQWQQPVCPQPPAAASDILSTASLILGCCSLLAWLIPLIGLLVSIPGLIFGIQKRNTTGIVLNAIGLALSVGLAGIAILMIVDEL